MRSVTVDHPRGTRVRGTKQASAVAAALAELVAEGAFTDEKALELARMYLHDNAARLYGEMK